MIKKIKFLLVALAFVGPVRAQLAGRDYTRIVGTDFTFPPSTPLEDFTGLTYNSLTGTFFMTDNDGDAVVEIQPNGTIVRIINISGLKNPDPAIANADPEGISWMGNQSYAVILGKGEELAIIQIGPGTTTINRNGATVYALFGDPHGVAYSAHDNTFFWVSENNPMRVVQSRINSSNATIETLKNIVVDGTIPADKLSDVAFFPKLSPNLFLLSHSSRAVMEVDITGGSVVMKSSFSLSSWDIPDAHGLAFGPDGRMYIVGKHVKDVPEDDFNVFTPNPAVGNQAPWVSATVPSLAYGDVNGQSLVRVDASATYDAESDPITRYKWTIDSSTTSLYDGPSAITTLNISTNGLHVLNLDVYSTVGSTSQFRRANFNITINLNQLPPGTSPLPSNAPALSVNYIHPGSGLTQAQISFELSSAGHADIHIFDSFGRLVRKLRSDDVPAGQYQQAWDLKNDDGAAIASGVYFALIKTPGNTRKEKVVVVR